MPHRYDQVDSDDLYMATVSLGWPLSSDEAILELPAMAEGLPFEGETSGLHVATELPTQLPGLVKPG